MNDNEIMECLSNDIFDIKLPPISEKVLQALYNKKSENPEHHTAPSKIHRKIPIKYIFAAMLTLLVASVPIIVILTNDASVPVAPESGNITDSSSNVSTVKEESDNPSVVANVLERIKKQQLYGAVSLSGKTEKELDELLLTYNSDSKVYEDDSYIYNFDSSGNLTELVNKTPVDENGSAVSEEEIKDKTKKLISEYYTEWEDTSYEINVQENRAGRPAWSVVVSKKASVISEQALFTYDSYGNIRRIVLPEYRNDTGLISKAEAVQIAMKELKSGKYNIPEFKNEDVEMMVETKKSNGVSCYAVTISNIIVDEKTITVIYFEISSITGEIINVII